MSPVLRNLFSKPYRSVSAAQAVALADGGACCEVTSGQEV